LSRIPREVIDEILLKSDMIGVIGRSTALRRQGKNWVGLCPFHNERTPSFNVNPEKGVWHCHGCKEGGNLVQFLQKIDSLSFPETVRRMGAELGIEVRLEEVDDDPAELRRKRLLELLDRTSRYYHDLLLRSPLAAEAKQYLSQRGVTPETIARFRLGWAPSSGTSLLQQLQRSEYLPQEGIDAGVLREKNGRVSDGLRSRIIFPIFDPTDRVIAFGGRVIDDSQPKYLNTPETEFYSKRRQLFGLNLHRQAIKKEAKAVVVEGYLDVVMMDQVGVELGVASLGTSLTPEQAKLLRKYTHDAVLAYDSDRAGQNATLKAIEIFEEEGLRVQVAVLPPGQDPDSVARQGGREELETHLKAARGVIDYLIERTRERFDLATPEGKEDFYREVIPAIEKIQNPVRQGSYLVKLAHLLGMTEERLNWRVKNRGQLQAVQQHRKLGWDSLQPEPMLFRVCAHLPEGLSYIREALSLDELVDQRLRQLFQALLACSILPGSEGNATDRPLMLQDLLAHIEDESLAKDLTQLLVDQPPESSIEDVQKLVKSIKNKHCRASLERLKRELLPELESGNLNPDDERYQEYIRLQKQLKGNP
jgi:DNA primase